MYNESGGEAQEKNSGVHVQRVWENTKISFVTPFYPAFKFLFLAFLDQNIHIQCGYVYIFTLYMRAYIYNL